MRQTGQVGHRVQLGESERLFLGLAEDLLGRLVTVSRISELAVTDDPDADQAATLDRWHTVRAVTDSLLQLVESYALGLRTHGKIGSLQLEPITVSGLLYDTADRLAPIAQQYGVELALDTGPRVQPVVADRAVLQSAFESLGQVFVMVQAEAEGRRRSVHLIAHRSRYGAVAGLYGNAMQLGVDSLRRARLVQGTARQPFQQLVGSSAAGVFIAESLLRTCEAHLHVARYHKLSGLAATLQPSRQLQLI